MSHRWWTFAIVCIALFMGMLDNLVVTTALPSIGRALHAGVADLEWTVNAYTLAFGVLMLPAAALGDRFGRRRILLMGVALFTGGSAASALAGTATELAFSRAVQGAGAALIMPLTLTILTGVFPPEKRAAAIGLWSGISGLGLAAGPLVGGAIVSGWSWNAVFWVNVPVGIVLFVLGSRQLTESYGEVRALDLPGIALVGAGLLGLVYGLIRGNGVGWSSFEILGALFAGTLLLLVFLARELTAREPMLDLSLFRSRAFSISNATAFLMSFGMFGCIFFVTLFVQNVLHFSALRAGLGTMPWTGTIMLVAPFAGILTGRLGARPLVVAGLACQAISLAWMATLISTSVAYTTLLPAFILGGFGQGLSFAPLASTVMGSVAESKQGQASGANSTIRELGGVFGVAILGAIFQHIEVRPADFVAAFHAVLLTGAGVLVIGLLAGAFLPALSGTGAEQRTEQTERTSAVQVA
jgi:EmrB/QacA subfamily drug resistance transporter